MALNIATLRTRTLTAIIFVVIMATGLLFNQWSFFLLFTIIHFGCWLEYQKLATLINPEYSTITPFHCYGIMLAGWCFLLYFTNDSFNLGALSVHSMGWWLGLLLAFLLPITEVLFSANVSLKNIGYSALGIAYISVPCGLLIDLMVFPTGSTSHSLPVLPLVIICCMWINDTMAYMVGSLIGKTPFSPISPKKTWEGTIGGIILCVALVTLLSRYIPVLRDFPLIHWLMISLIAAIAGTFGDLLESKLKRMAGVKDSGRIMPGHGGFLDRFDSLLIATPFVWAYVEIFLR
ncbi:MAG: phosphatidate cytidylyltransferase [Flavitalea sp.]